MIKTLDQGHAVVPGDFVGRITDREHVSLLASGDRHCCSPYRAANGTSHRTLSVVQSRARAPAGGGRPPYPSPRTPSLQDPLVRRLGGCDTSTGAYESARGEVEAPEGVGLAERGIWVFAKTKVLGTA